jgi:fengycin family lipopeptide synthetase D
MTIDSFKDAEGYWLDKLSGELNEIKIPGDFPGNQTFEAKNIEFLLEGHLNDELVRISKSNDLSLYILLLRTF